MILQVAIIHHWSVLTLRSVSSVWRREAGHWRGRHAAVSWLPLLTPPWNYLSTAADSTETTTANSYISTMKLILPKPNCVQLAQERDRSIVCNRKIVFWFFSNQTQIYVQCTFCIIWWRRACLISVTRPFLWAVVKKKNQQEAALTCSSVVTQKTPCYQTKV